MEGLLAFLGMVAIAAGAALLSRKQRRRRLAAWHRAAQRAGLAGVVADEHTSVVLARAGEVTVRVEVQPSDESGFATKIVADGSGLGRGGLSLRREGIGTALRKRVAGEREIEIGDPSFDEEFFVQGDPALVLALLDGETQAALRRVLRDQLVTRRGDSVRVHASVSDGVLEVRLRDSSLTADPQRAPGVLAAVVEVAQRLVPPPDLAARIGRNLRTETEAGVRIRCLRTLAREFREHPATREALLAAREDPDAEVRLEAGIALDRDGRETVLAIARDERAPDEASARAVAVLAVDLSAEEAASMLRSALRKRRLATARECLRVLGGRRGPGVVPALAKVLAIEKGPLAAVAAEALGATGEASAESALVVALDDPAGEVRAASARALGRVGTTTAVQPLKALEERDASSRSAARQSIAEIQARLTGAEPGQLSLAGGESGELSLAGAEEGRLSLASSCRESAVEADPSRPGRAEVAQNDEGGLRDAGRRASLR